MATDPQRGEVNRRPAAADGTVEVYAGGGVVVDDRGRILLVHRPRYDDWTLPKGKLDAGESLAECALREVAEETGCECELGPEVMAVRYRDQKGRCKEVRYWRMTPHAGSGARFEPNHEVDEIRWLEPEAAVALLSYGHDREVLRAAVGPRFT